MFKSYNNWINEVLAPTTDGVENSDVSDVAHSEFTHDEEEVRERINKRFAIMTRMTKGMITGNIRSMIVSGGPGIGKSFDIEEVLKTSKIYRDFVKGTVSAPGLYKALYEARNGGIVIFDDCDKVFDNEESLNILKHALDSSDVRTISYRKEKTFQDNNGDDIPSSFEFKGGVIFITNIDFVEMVAQQSKLSPHFEALMSRSFYLDLTLKTIFDRYVRVKDIFLNKMMQKEKLSKKQASEILQFVDKNKDKFIELSLRTVKHIIQLYKFGQDWQDIIKVTKFKV